MISTILFLLTYIFLARLKFFQPQKSKDKLIYDLQMQVLALQQQLANLKSRQKRIKTKPKERIFYLLLYALWPKLLKHIKIVEPKTLVLWHRKLYKKYWKRISQPKTKPIGRPTVPSDILHIIKRMLSENVFWRAPRIHAELLKLGIDISLSSVSRHIRKINPDPLLRKKWKQFIKNESVFAMDFFVQPSLFFKQIYGFFVIHHKTRKIIHFATTYHPTEIWIINQLKAAFDSFDHPDLRVKYLIHDNDKKFSEKVLQTIKTLGIISAPTTPASPWQNPYAERFVGTIRREHLNHIIHINDHHLFRTSRKFIEYYNNDRPHLSLTKDSPNGRKVCHGNEGSKLIALPRSNGLHHKYLWKKSA